MKIDFTLDNNSFVINTDNPLIDQMIRSINEPLILVFHNLPGGPNPQSITLNFRIDNDKLLLDQSW